MNIIQAIDDDNVFGPFFRGATWDVWRVFLAALFGLQMTPEQLAVFQKFTARTTAPTSPLHEAWLCIGRRGGKSFVLATIAVFLAAFRDWRPYLGPGEVGTVMVIAADRRQARVIMRYVLGLLKAVPMLSKLIDGVTRESITLRNRVVVEIHTASFRSTRGYTVVAALLDECAYWPTDETSSEPDIEVINAVRPAMATIPGSMLLAASSPYARKGALWSAYAKHFAKDRDPVLVWQAETRAMNALVPQDFINAHMAEDPARASAEYLAQFRSDLEAFVSREVIEACLGSYYEIPPSASTTYYAFVDPSGGSKDSFALAIAHRDGDGVVIDAVRETQPPLAPEAVIAEQATLLKSYRCMKVMGDRYGGEFPREQFQKRGVRYEISTKTKSEAYVDFLPMLNSGGVTLPRSDRLIAQLCGLERTTARGTGKDTVDHPRDQHDDLANVVAGAAVLARSHGGYAEALARACDDFDEAEYEARRQAYRNEFAQRILQLSGGRCWPR